MQVRIVVEVESSVKMVRPETGTIKLVIKPTEKFEALDAEGKKEWLTALTQEQRFSYLRDGELSFRSDGFDQYFTIEKEGENWEYNGGECNIIETHYDSTARRK